MTLEHAVDLISAARPLIVDPLVPFAPDLPPETWAQIVSLIYEQQDNPLVVARSLKLSSTRVVRVLTYLIREEAYQQTSSALQAAIAEDTITAQMIRQSIADDLITLALITETPLNVRRWAQTLSRKAVQDALVNQTTLEDGAFPPEVVKAQRTRLNQAGAELAKQTLQELIAAHKAQQTR